MLLQGISFIYHNQFKLQRFSVMYNQFKGSLRRPPQDQYASLSNSRQFQETHNSYIKNEAFYHTDRSQYSSYNKFHSTSNFQKKGYQYDKNIPVKISSSDKIEQEQVLRVEMQVVNEKGGSAIKVNLTDDHQHVFLWCMYLKDVNYMAFKMEQKLKVDFSEFPYFLTKMMDSLLEQPKKYICRFEIETAQNKGNLKILQSNQFKQNLNLQLKFSQATNEQLIQYLNEKITKTLQRQSDMSIQIQRGGEEMIRQTNHIRQLQCKLLNIQTQKTNEVSNLNNESKSKLNQLKQQYLNKQSQYKKQIQNQKRGLITKYESDYNKLKQKYQELIKRFQLSQECKDRFQSKNRQLESKINLLTSQNDNLRKVSQTANIHLGKYQQSSIEQQRLNTQLKCKVDSLKQQMVDKQAIIQSTKEIKVNQSSQVQILEANISSLKKELQNQDKIIKQKQQEIKQLKIKEDGYKMKNKENTAKLRQKDQVIMKIHKRTEQMQEQTQEKNKIINQLTKIKQQSDTQIRTMRDELSSCKIQIQQNAKVILDNEQMMRFQNKQITALSAGSRMGQTMIQSTFKPSFNHEYPSIMSKSSLSPSIPMASGERIQPQIKKYSGSTNFQIPTIKTQNTNALNQQQDSQDFREQTLRVNAVKYRSPSQNRS